jgi:hypothetical protein
MNEPGAPDAPDHVEPVRATGPQLRAGGGGPSRVWLVNVGLVVLVALGGILLTRPGLAPAVGDTSDVTASPAVPTPEVAASEVATDPLDQTPEPSAVATPPTAAPTLMATPLATPRVTPKPQPGPTDSQLTPVPTREITVFAAHVEVVDICLDVNGYEQVSINGYWEGPVGITGVEMFLDGVSQGSQGFGTPQKTGMGGIGAPATIGVSHIAMVKFFIDGVVVGSPTSAPFVPVAGAPCP